MGSLRLTLCAAAAAAPSPPSAARRPRRRTRRTETGSVSVTPSPSPRAARSALRSTAATGTTGHGSSDAFVSDARFARADGNGLSAETPGPLRRRRPAPTTSGSPATARTSKGTVEVVADRQPVAVIHRTAPLARRPRHAGGGGTARSLAERGPEARRPRHRGTR